MATNAEWHEDYDKMSKEARVFPAIKSLQEELIAVDWYDRRAQATKTSIDEGTLG